MSVRDACALAVHGARPLACVQWSVVRWRPLPRDDVASLVVRWPRDWSLVAGRCATDWRIQRRAPRLSRPCVALLRARFSWWRPPPVAAVRRCSGDVVTADFF
ncbi:hypothetical protein F511_47271 [Dorcoceras hygrometricum]|uniref:Uncharacterized protein n=1 Tax=Dorcoceras hygrometricum TaxID=472368 RepID=A0A2Z6ZRE9_9LAMI|nr:hypothetical protein F511_47271 [Dorcoceras hygrometricum]